MGQQLVWLGLASLLGGGCSLIYSSSNLPELIDAPPDAPDASMPDQLRLTSVSPAVLVEGTGAGGSRAAIVVVNGENFVPGATLAITAHAGETLTPSIVVDNAAAVVGSGGTMLAVPVTVNVDMDLGAAASLRLDVTVMQPGLAAPVTLAALAEDAPVLAIQGLAELSGAAVLPTAAPNVFSRVDVTSLAAANASSPHSHQSTGLSACWRR